MCMKKGWKIFWIVCGSVAALGMILTIVGTALGGSFISARAAMWKYENKKEHIEEVIERKEEAFERDLEERERGKQAQGNFERENVLALYDQAKIPVDTANILEIDLPCFQIVLEEIETDVSYITCEISDMPEELEDQLIYVQEGNEQEILLKNAKRFRNFFDGVNPPPSLTLKIPAGYVTQLDVSVGMGTLEANNLNINKLDIEAGAGVVDLKGFTANVLDVEVGTGKVNLAGTVQSKASIDCSMGTVDFQATGSKEDYSYDIECEVGKVTVGNETFGGLAMEKKIMNGGPVMEIECATGTVNISFEK